MKSFAAFCAAVLFALFAASAIRAQTNQALIPGTQVRVMLSNGLSTTVARSGDPFTGVVAEPVFAGTQIILPAGAKVHGTVTSRTRHPGIDAFSGQSGFRCSAAALR